MVAYPTLWLDLHYLFTFYGDESQQIPQLLLGRVCSALHAMPVMSPEFVTKTMAVALGQTVEDPRFRACSEAVRVSPVYFTLEELAKLWSFLLHAEYHLSTAFMLSVATIRSPGQPLEPFPVRKFLLKSLPHGGPRLRELTPQRLVTGRLLTLWGNGFKGGRIRVLFGNLEQVPSLVENRKIQVSPPPELAAGLHSVRVRVGDERGAALTESEPLPFTVIPRIQNVSPLRARAGEVLILRVIPAPCQDAAVALILGQDRGGGHLLLPAAGRHFLCTHQRDASGSDSFHPCL